MKPNIHFFSFAIILLVAIIGGCQKARIEEQVSILPGFDFDNASTKSEVGVTDSLTTNPNPTHKVLRITIESMEQLQTIERDTSIIIFHYCSSADPDKSAPIRYSPSGDGQLISCDGEGALDIDLYPIDVYWPVEKSIPSEYKCVHKGDIYMPSDKDYISGDRGTNAHIPLTIDGQIRSYDNRLEQYKPVAHARIQYYSLISGNLVLRNTETDSLGRFTLNKPDTISDILLYLENSNFAVRDSITSSVKCLYVGTLGLHPAFIQKDFSANFFLDVYQGASYYFYKNNDLLSQITKYHSSSSISIYAVNAADPKFLGRFRTNGGSPYIIIYNPYNNDGYNGAASKVFGTTLHELGHATHYIMDAPSMSVEDTLIRESFASFFGWYNVKEYYSDVAPTHASVNSICTQGRQGWTQSSTNIHYTPFYIDLYDNYNQYYYYYTNVNYDVITGVPISVILNLSIGQMSFQSVENGLSTYINQYFTGSEYNDFVAPYSIFL